MDSGVKVTDATNSALPERPYPGLNYYENKSNASRIFAGRDADVVKCGEVLESSRVLILHGRTGCGKSSFLRVGLAPSLIGSRIQTQHLPDGSLDIFRTGARPLRTLACAFVKLVEDVRADRVPAPKRKRGGGSLDDVLGAPVEEFVEEASADKGVLLAAISRFQVARPGLSALLVLDQAEEMWTLGRDQTDDAGKGKTQRTESIEQVDTTEERAKLFSFIRELCGQEKCFLRLLISMRTEYRGQFDDELRKNGEVPGVFGYYLNELDEAAIVKAILCPTFDETDASGVSAGATYKFKYEGWESASQTDRCDALIAGHKRDSLPALIARKLLRGVPRGGVLPVLQVTCLRLWETTSDRRDSEGDHWIIRRSDFDQLGDINRQIELFVQERLEQALREVNTDDKELLSEAEKWYRMLNEALVNIESDGRVTTKKASPRRLRELGKRMQLRAFDGKLEDDTSNAKFDSSSVAGAVLEKLRKNNILREDDVTEGDRAADWSLGHDSVGLTLNRWSQVYGYQFETMSKMDMMAQSTPDRFGAASLFGPNFENPETPDEYLRRYKLQTIVDSVWDHQILQYAVRKKFAERLGLIIESDSYDTVGDRDTPPTMSFQRAWREMNRIEPDEDGAAFVIAWPRSEFPAKKERLAYWTDIVITNAYQGYGLLCPPDLCEMEGFQPFEETRRVLGRGAASVDTRPSLKEFQASMEKVYNFISTKNREGKDCSIWMFDKSAEMFLDLVLKLSGLKDFQQQQVKRWARFVRHDESTDKLARDPIFAKILQSGGTDFMIGTAFGRALATRTGYKSQIDVQDLSTLIDWFVDNSADKSETKDTKEARKRGLIKEYQVTQTHTSWQLSMAHDDIADERVDELLFRLASLGFYTAEYIRTNADDFVRYIDEQLQKTAPKGTFKLDRDFIRSSIRSCYAFFPFEQYAAQFLERSSPMAYWQESGNETSKVRYIYSRMLDFRADFFRDFKIFNEQYIELMSESGKEERLLSGGVSAEAQVALKNVNDLRDQAWRNFRILNFYDASRFMQKAREALAKVERHPRLPI